MDLLREPAKEHAGSRPRDGPGPVCTHRSARGAQAHRRRRARPRRHRATCAKRYSAPSSLPSSAPRHISAPDTRTGHRKGSRAPTLTTTAGNLELRMPKLCADLFFPSSLERRRWMYQALRPGRVTCRPSVPYGVTVSLALNGGLRRRRSRLVRRPAGRVRLTLAGGGGGPLPTLLEWLPVGTRFNDLVPARPRGLVMARVRRSAKGPRVRRSQEPWVAQKPLADQHGAENRGRTRR